MLERVAGIEPAHSAWEADRLPLHHTRTRLFAPAKNGAYPGSKTDLSREP